MNKVCRYGEQYENLDDKERAEIFTELVGDFDHRTQRIAELEAEIVDLKETNRETREELDEGIIIDVF